MMLAIRAVRTIAASMTAFLCLVPVVAAAQRVLDDGSDAELPIRIVSADRVRQDRDVQELFGSVVLERGELRLSAARMRYSRRDGILEAWDAVEIRDPDFLLECARLSFDIHKEEVVAWGDPRLIQREGTGARSFETELVGVQVRIFAKERRVQVLERVVLSRFLLDKGERASVELRVRCRVVDALTQARRSVFKGDVSIETPTIGAVGQRALFDQMAGTFYILGGAKAWNHDESGQAINVIRGEKIVYFLDDRRSVVIGGVTADVEPDVRTGSRVIPLRVDPVTRSGEVMADE